jgi:hypothetical protein
LVGIKRITTKSCHPERSAAKSKDLHFAGSSANFNTDEREAQAKQ